MDDQAWEREQERRRAVELADLRFHWGSGYTITYNRGTFVAVRNDTGEMLTAGTADELRDKIGADYIARPVPRR